MSLSGYGVELDIKSTEYKAEDDTKVDEGNFQLLFIMCCVLDCLYCNWTFLLNLSLKYTRTIAANVDSLESSEESSDDEVDGFLFHVLRWSFCINYGSKEVTALTLNWCWLTADHFNVIEIIIHKSQKNCVNLRNIYLKAGTK